MIKIECAKCKQPVLTNLHEGATYCRECEKVITIVNIQMNLAKISLSLQDIAASLKKKHGGYDEMD